MRNVQMEITKAIQTGQTLMTYKTKAGVGRKSVTAGKYRMAVGLQRYAVIIGGEANICMSAIEAAQFFIEYVGRNDAWDALKGRGRERNPA
jgi:hypothetical protein